MMDSKLFNAILSMDSYNRGYNAGIDLRMKDVNGNLIEDSDTIYTVNSITQYASIGNATISATRGQVDAQAIGFYALAYEVGGVTTVSYRGTDNAGVVPSFFSESEGSDFWNGWLGGAGLQTSQSEMAFEFYQTVLGTLPDGSPIDPRSGNIILTGHSLGGGLAGLVAGAYGKGADVFDNMPFEFALANIKYFSDNPVPLTNHDEMKALVYSDHVDPDGDGIGETWDTNISGIEATSLLGEILSPSRITQVGTSENFLRLDAAGEILPEGTLTTSLSDGLSDDISAFSRHSMSALVIRMFADTEIQGQTDWYASAKYFWPVLFDDAFAENLGVGNVDTQVRDEGEFHGVLRDIIAYSAIDEGALVFGDTGIRAFYNDANDLGAAIVASETGSSTTLSAPKKYGTEISEVLTGFAGRLAVNKITQQMSTDVLEGVLKYTNDVGDHSLVVNFREDTWNPTEFDLFRDQVVYGPPQQSTPDGETEALSTKMRKVLIDPVLDNTNYRAELEQVIEEEWGIDFSINNYESVVFAMGGSITAFMPESSLSTQASLFVGSNVFESVVGSTGRDLILGGHGDDTIYGSTGIDIIDGGEGTGDKVSYENIGLGLSVTIEEIFLGSGFYNEQLAISYNSGKPDLSGSFTDFAFGVESLTLSSDKDEVIFKTGSFENFGTFDGGEEKDTLDFSALQTNVIVDLYDGGVTTGNSSVTINEVLNFEHIIGADYAAGGDKFIAGEGSALYDGLAGIDELDFGSLSLAAVEVNLLDGNVIKYGTSLGAPQIDKFSSVEKFTGTDGADFFRSQEGVISINFDGGGQTPFGRDILDFSHYMNTNGVIVDLGLNFVSDGAGGTITVTDFEEVIGSNEGDLITGDVSTNWLFGQGGDDVLSGEGGVDYLFGGSGFDILQGGSDSDLYYFSDTGVEDVITETSGALDTIYLAGELRFTGDDMVVRSGTTATIQDIASFGDDVEILQFSDGSRFQMTNLGRNSNGLSSIIGTLDPEELNGTEGADIIDGLGGGDTINGGGGDDWITANGTSNGEAGSDHITGIGHLIGGSGEDFLTSMSDGNKLDGGSGNDFLNGNGNNDTIYIAGNGVDVISDTGTGGEIWIQGGSLSNVTYELAGNESLIISPAGASGSDKIIVLDYSPSSIDKISFDDGLTFHTIPVDDIGFQTDIFANALVGSAGNNVYVAAQESGQNTQIDTASGNNSYVFDLSYTGRTVINSIDTPELTVQETITLENVASLDDVSIIRYSDTPSSLNLYYGAAGEIVLTGSLANNYVINVGGQDHALTSLDFITQGSAVDDTSIVGDLEGFSENDTIFGGFGNDDLQGGLGNDILDGGEGDDTLDGGEGNDTFIDSAGNDLYFVGVGNDILEVGSGVNEVRAQDGITNLSMVTIDFSSYGSEVYRDFSGSNANDYKLSYGGGTVVLDHYVNLTETPTVLFADGTSAQLANISIAGYGSEVDDSYNELFFSSQNDLIYAGGGNDAFTLTDGDDTIYGGAGNDTLGKHLLSGNTPHGTGSLEAYGEEGDDTLRGALGDDILDGGEGNDFIEDISGGDNQMFGGAGDDNFSLGWDGGDTVDGGEGNDSVFLFSANTYAPSSYSYDIDLDAQTVTSSAGVHQLISIENAAGSENDDTLTGNDQNNFLYGWGGDDDLFGGAGDDLYYFEGETDGFGVPLGFGDDVIDDISGASDSIQLVETTNINAIVISETGFGNDMEISIGGNSITIENQLAAGSTSQVENLILADGTTYDLVNYLNWYDPNTAGQGITQSGTALPDVFIGSVGLNDTVDYSASTTPLFVDLSAGIGLGGYALGDTYSSIESIIGSAFDDVIVGNGDVNELLGGLGNDIIVGGAGNDLLSGGGGDDTYVFNIGDGINTILETSGFDTLQLGVGITFGDLTFTQNGNDLDIQIASGFAITDFFSGDADKVVEQILFDDGSTFDLTSLLIPTPVSPIIGSVAEAENLVDPAATLNGLSEITIAVHVQASAIGTDKGIFDTESPDGIDDALTMRYDAHGWGGGGQNVIKIGLQTTEGQIGFESAANVQTTNPQHIVMTWKSGEALKLYIDGIETTPTYDTGPLGGVITNVQDLVLALGAKNAGGWAGSINDFQVYDVALDAAAVDELFMNASPNLSPVAVDDLFSGDQDADVIGNVLDNNWNGIDSDPDGDALSVVAGIYATANGSVDIAANGDFTYSPNAGFAGIDNFIYTLEDGQGGSDTGVVQIYVDQSFVPVSPIIRSVAEAENLVDPAATLNGLSEITIAVHVQASAIGTDKGIFDTESPDGIDDALTMRYDAHGWGGGGQNVIKIGLQTTEGQIGFESAANVQTTNPQHIVMTWKSGEALKLYIDGIETTPTYDTGPLGGVITNVQDLVLALGAKNTGGWAGSIDDFQVYDVALDPAAIDELFSYESGTSGDDTLSGSASSETILGFAGNDTLDGQGGDDTLYGGEGSDYLYGGDGDDVLYGGAGVDMLYGQGGADTFVFDDTASSDNIQDFDLSAGDKLDVSDLLVGYDPLTDAITDFVQITETSGNSYLNVDADGGADNFVQVAYIYNETGLTDEEALETSGNLIAA